MSLLIAALVAGWAGSVPLWPGLSTDLLVDGSRAPAEVKAVVAALAPELARCAQAADFDVVIEVKVSGPGSVLGSAAVVLSPHARSRLSLACVENIFESLSFKDRGNEPPSHLLLRLTTDAHPPDLRLPELRRALQRRQKEIARCVRRARLLAGNGRGFVVARIEFDASGHVVVNVDGDQPRLRACVQDGLAGLAVADFPGPRTVLAPFVFDDPPDVDPQTRPAWEHPSLASWLGCDFL